MLSAEVTGHSAWDPRGQLEQHPLTVLRLEEAKRRQRRLRCTSSAQSTEHREGNNAVSMRSSARCRGASGRVKKKGSVTLGRAARSRSLVAAAAAERCGSRVSAGGGQVLWTPSLRLRDFRAGERGCRRGGGERGHGDASVHALVALLRSSI
jgi:hypothetical protein